MLLLMFCLFGTTFSFQRAANRSLMVAPILSTDISRSLRPFVKLAVSLPEDVEDGWVQTNGPMGGYMNTVKLQPGNPETLFAGGYGGVFKSVNGGASWERLPQFVPAAQPVFDLFIDPSNPLIMYALSGQLHKTTDGGQSWTALDVAGDGTYLRCGAMHPASPDRLLVGAQRVVFLSKRQTGEGHGLLFIYPRQTQCST